MTIEPNKSNNNNKRKRKRKLNLLRFSIVIVVVMGLVLIGSISGFVMASMKDIPAWDPKALEPNLPSFIFDTNDQLITKIFIEDREPVQIKDVPDVVKEAFLATEDVRFYDHKGIDLRRIVGAIIFDIKEGRAAQGGSTITQQLVKKAFLNPEKKIKRKIQEMVLALKLEREYTKDQIFEMYLNRIYFGHGAYGIQSAAQIYFGESVENLTLEQAAVLAGLPQAPSAYDPYKNPERAKKRRDLVLTMMANNDFISQAQAEETKQKEIVLKGSTRHKAVDYPYPYFIDYITDDLLKKYGEQQVFKGGLKVYTTLDPKIQSIAENAMADPKNFPASSPDKGGLLQPQGAAVVLDPHTGHIKALVGGREHTQKLQFNRATDAKRQPGSAFKPIIAYGPAVEKGDGAASIALDEPAKFGKYQPENYDSKYRGPVTYRTAMAVSLNVAAVRVLNDVGVSEAVKFAKKLGITSLTADDENLAIALGGLHYGVSPLEMASAYGAFANKGIHVDPIAIKKVEDRYGTVIDEFKPEKKVVMKDTTAFIVTELMKSVVRNGTGTNASLGSRPAVGKTGTTNQGKDIWFAGYTPELVTVVWVGHDEPKPMPRVYGSTFPAKIWKQIMSKSLEGVEIKEFEVPNDAVKATVCSRTGLRPGKNCPQSELTTDWFAKGTVPGKECDAHVYVEVCADSGLLPTEFCPNTITKAFLKRGEAHKDSKLDIYEPVQKCGVHGPNTKVVTLCTDPSHGDHKYLANVPNKGEDGGCPKDSRTKITLGEGEFPPMEYCPIPDHKVYVKPPEGPEVPTEAEKPKPNKPNNPEAVIQSNKGKGKR